MSGTAAETCLHEYCNFEPEIETVNRWYNYCLICQRITSVSCASSYIIFQYVTHMLDCVYSCEITIALISEHKTFNSFHNHFSELEMVQQHFSSMQMFSPFAPWMHNINGKFISFGKTLLSAFSSWTLNRNRKPQFFTAYKRRLWRVQSTNCVLFWWTNIFTFCLEIYYFMGRKIHPETRKKCCIHLLITITSNCIQFLWFSSEVQPLLAYSVMQALVEHDQSIIVIALSCTPI